MSTSETYGAGQRRPQDWELLEAQLQRALEEKQLLADVAEAAYQYRHHGDLHWLETLDAAITTWRRKAGLVQVKLLPAEGMAKVRTVVQAAIDASPTISTIMQICAKRALINDDELVVLSVLTAAVDDLATLGKKK